MFSVLMVLIVLSGLIWAKKTKDNSCFIGLTSLRTEKTGGQTPNKNSFRSIGRSLSQVGLLISCLKIDNSCGLTERKSGSGPAWSARTADNILIFQNIILNDDDMPSRRRSLLS